MELFFGAVGFGFLAGCGVTAFIAPIWIFSEVMKDKSSKEPKT